MKTAWRCSSAIRGILDAYILKKSSLTVPRAMEVEMLCSGETKKYIDKMLADLGLKYDEISFTIENFITKIGTIEEKYPKLAGYRYYYELEPASDGTPQYAFITTSGEYGRIIDGYVCDENDTDYENPLVNK